MTGLSPHTLLAVQGLAEESGASATQARLDQAKRSHAVGEASQEFEAIFLSQMLAPMFETVEEDPMFGGGPGESMYRSLLVEEYGQILAQTGGVGLADQLQQELIRLQEIEP